MPEVEAHITGTVWKVECEVGQEVNEGTGAEATTGHILLQSEGAPIYFRNIMLKRLK